MEQVADFIPWLAGLVLTLIGFIVSIGKWFGVQFEKKDLVFTDALKQIVATSSVEAAHREARHENQLARCEQDRRATEGTLSAHTTAITALATSVDLMTNRHHNQRIGDTK